MVNNQKIDKPLIWAYNDLAYRQRIPENEAYERETEEVLVNHPTLGKSTTSSETRSSEIMITLKFRAKREAKRSWSSYHLERNERSKGSCWT